jgi:hypothetical protein
MIRKMNYREYYYPNKTEHDARDMEVHISMCCSHQESCSMTNLDRPLHRTAATICDVHPRHILHHIRLDALRPKASVRCKEIRKAMCGLGLLYGRREA